MTETKYLVIWSIQGEWLVPTSHLFVTYIVQYFLPDTFQMHRKLPSVSNSAVLREELPRILDLCVLHDGVVDDNEMDAYGTGLKNEVGEYNCFLNVIIQVGVRSMLFFIVWMDIPQTKDQFRCSLHSSNLS